MKKSDITRGDMDKFWKWMEENGYVKKGKLEQYIFFDEHTIKNNSIEERKKLRFGDINFITKQMLIGYMIEYIIDTGIHNDRLLCFNKGNSINDIYDSIKKMIEN